jgi:hypothetical protein
MNLNEFAEFSGGRRPTPTGFPASSVQFSDGYSFLVFRIFFCHNFLAGSFGKNNIQNYKLIFENSCVNLGSV